MVGYRAGDEAAARDAVLRVAFDDADDAAAATARAVMTALGAEPSQLLLNKPQEVYTASDEARRFLPRLCVLAAEARWLFVVPSIRETTFADCCECFAERN